MNVAGISLSLIGLAFIVIGWAYQFASMKKKSTGMHKEFLIMYAVGTLLLTIDGFLSGMLDLAIMNIVAFVLSGMILLKEQ